jgi:fumarate reductase flavoprotein subunit
MMKILKDRFEQRGGEIRFSMPVIKIRRETEAIAGVVAKDRTGKTYQADARVVIVGTGGYPNDKAMLRQHGGFELGRDLWLLPAIKLNGSGIRMAWDVGAVPDGMDVMLMFGAFELTNPTAEHIKFGTETRGIGCLAGQPYLWINQQGQRFVNEGVFVSQYKANALARQPNRCAYLIFDGDTKRYVEQEGFDHVSPVTPDIMTVPDIDALFRDAAARTESPAFVAESLPHLALQIGVDQSLLQRTVNEYNRFLRQRP